MKSVSSVFILVLLGLILCSAFGRAVNAASVPAAYRMVLNVDNQSRLAALLDSDVGICGTDTSIKGVVNTSDNGIVIMVLTAEDQTLDQWKETSCAKVLLKNDWAVRLSLPSGSTDEDLQKECLPEGRPVCGVSETSLCKCSASQTSIYVAPISKQPEIAAIRATGGACNGFKNVITPLNTQLGIFVVVHSAPGQTTWEFERTKCGSSLVSNSSGSYSDPAVVKPIIDECFEHGDHGHCGTTPTTTCPCSASQNVIYNIVGETNIQAFAALRATGGKCAGTATNTNPTRTIIFGSLLTEVGLQLYVKTSLGRTKWDFESTPCGIEIDKIKNTVKVAEEAQKVVDKCWEHGDHAHCGPAECPCKKPSSLNITPVVFKMNMTHASLEGRIYFNNFFIRSLRLDPDCTFSRNLATYADGLGNDIRLYIDNFKSTCTVEKMNEIKVTSFQAYWADSLPRWEGGEKEEDSHAGHEHFEVMATQPKIPPVPGIISIRIEPSFPLKVDSCWNPSTDGLKCVAENSACPLLCPVGAHCHKNSECGTGRCAAPDHDHDHDDDDHGHSHNVVGPATPKSFRLEIDIDPIDLTALDFDTLGDDDHHHHDDLVCRLINTASLSMTLSVSVITFFITALIF